MKRALLIGLGLLISLALVAPASALIFVHGFVYKDKDVTVTEIVQITKRADIDIRVREDLNAAAEAIALANQENLFTFVTGNNEFAYDECAFAAPAAYGNDRKAEIKSSVGVDSDTYNLGIVGVNQDAGNANNQGNNVALAVTDVDNAFANAESSAAQFTIGNGVRTDSRPSRVIGYTTDRQPIYAETETKSDLIQNSLNSNDGIVGANQSVGNMNNQLNSVALAAGLGDVSVALSEADLGQFAACNVVYELGTTKADKITGSVIAHHGILGVNQSAGNMDSQANIVSLSAIH